MENYNSPTIENFDGSEAQPNSATALLLVFLIAVAIFVVNIGPPDPPCTNLV